MKKILIIGEISDFGGREIEAKNIASALVAKAEVKLFSVTPMSSKSVALIKHKNFTWSNIELNLFKSHIGISIFAWFTKLYFKRKEEVHHFVKNKLSIKIFNFEKRIQDNLFKEIVVSDKIIFCGELSSKWLPIILKEASKNNIYFILRTTGQIKSINKLDLELLKKINSILIHSTKNLNALPETLKSRALIIDQTTLQEEKLLQLKLEEKTELTLGYLGRFDEEKGILPLLKIIKNTSYKALIAGKGRFYNKVNEIINESPNLKLYGEVKTKDLVHFYQAIDVLIIPSLEEAGPLVAIEAMCAGKIIISTKVGAMEDRLRNLSQPLWFDTHKSQTLLGCFNVLNSLTKSQILKLKEENRIIYLENYSKSTISELYLNLIKN